LDLSGHLADKARERKRMEGRFVSTWHGAGAGRAVAALQFGGALDYE